MTRRTVLTSSYLAYQDGVSQGPQYMFIQNRNYKAYTINKHSIEMELTISSKVRFDSAEASL